MSGGRSEGRSPQRRNSEVKPIPEKAINRKRFVDYYLGLQVNLGCKKIPFFSNHGAMQSVFALWELLQTAHFIRV